MIPPEKQRKRPRVLSLLGSIPGWLTPEEAEFLYSLSSETDGNIVELGAYQGRSTVVLASGLKKSGRHNILSRMVTIDTFRGSPEHQPGEQYFNESTLDPVQGCIDTRPVLEKNLREFHVSDVVEIWQCDVESAAAAFQGTISLLFVDADHEYQAVTRQLQAWTPLLRSGGIVVLHDVGDWPGPTRAAADLLTCGFSRHDQVGTALALIAPGNITGMFSYEDPAQKGPNHA